MAGSTRSTRASAPAYALYRRGAEAVAVRATATDLLKSDHEASVMAVAHSAAVGAAAVMGAKPVALLSVQVSGAV